MHTIRALWVGLCVVLGVLLASAGAQAAPDSRSQSKGVTFGIFPYVTPVQLVKFHQPLKDLLQAALQQPVSLVTAPPLDATRYTSQSPVLGPAKRIWRPSGDHVGE